MGEKCNDAGGGRVRGPLHGRELHLEVSDLLGKAFVDPRFQGGEVGFGDELAWMAFAMASAWLRSMPVASSSRAALRVSNVLALMSCLVRPVRDE